MERFDSAGALLRAYRESNDKTQEAFADDVGLSVRALSRLESGGSRFPMASARRIAHGSFLAFEALLRVMAGFPVWYDFQSNRFATSPFDLDVVNEKVVTSQLFGPHISDVGEVRPMDMADLERVVQFEEALFIRETHEEELPAPFRELFAEAMRRTPSLNLTVHGPHGLLEGHLLCFALGATGVQKLAPGGQSERALSARDLLSWSAATVAGIHIYALAATQSVYAYMLLRVWLRAVCPVWPKLTGSNPACRLSYSALTADDRDLAKKLGLVLSHVDSPPRVNPSMAWGQSRPAEMRPPRAEVEVYARSMAELPWIEAYGRQEHWIRTPRGGRHRPPERP